MSWAFSSATAFTATNNTRSINAFILLLLAVSWTSAGAVPGTSLTHHVLHDVNYS